MLISTDEIFNDRTLVAIGVDEWRLEGEYRCFDLIPHEEGDNPFVEVGVIAAKHKPTLVAPAMPDWGPLQRFSAEKGEFGYPLTEEIADDLYCVWDDGAHQHLERAQRLYAFYKHRIDFYRDVALKFHLAQYRKDVRSAKEKGWDAALIKEPTAYRYYGY